MSKLSFFVTFCLVFVTMLVSSVYGFPSGAGGCAAGKAAVGGDHLSTSRGKKVVSKKLSEKGVKVSIGGTTIAAGSKATLQYGKSLAVTVTGSGMKGILIRVQGTGASSAFTSSTLQKCKYCPNTVGSGTHKNSKTVSSYAGSVKFAKSTSGVVFDITIVFDNDSKLSEYAYGKVTVDFTKK